MRPGCDRPAAARVAFDPVALQLWLDPLARRSAPVQELCEFHVERLTVPRGWSATDRRPGVVADVVPGSPGLSVVDAAPSSTPVPESEAEPEPEPEPESESEPDAPIDAGEPMAEPPVVDLPVVSDSVPGRSCRRSRPSAARCRGRLAESGARWTGFGSVAAVPGLRAHRPPGVHPHPARGGRHPGRGVERGRPGALGVGHGRLTD